MGWHECEYLTRDKAKQLGLRHADFANSSGALTLAFQSGRSWRMPDMALLYIELGWLPPAEFVDDIMNSPLKPAQGRQLYDGVRIGYLNPKDDPLMQPFKVSDELPAGFLDKFEAHYKQATLSGNRFQTRSLIIAEPHD